MATLTFHLLRGVQLEISFEPSLQEHLQYSKTRDYTPDALHQVILKAITMQKGCIWFLSIASGCPGLLPTDRTEKGENLHPSINGERFIHSSGGRYFLYKQEKAFFMSASRLL